ncbi:MAG: hypothetical protein FWF10_03895 [Clostridiales bacterium]|nr:hypothetical protein [Clostridiales bacterium]
MKKTTALLLTLLLVCALLPAATLPARAASATVNLNSYTTVSQVQSALTMALSGAAAGDIVSVTGSFANADAALIFSIPSGVTLQWGGVYTGSFGILLMVNGAGTLDVVAGGALQNDDGYAVYSGSTTSTIRVSGGTVSSADSDAISSAGYVVVTDGTVTAASAFGCAIFASGASSTVSVSGGIVSNSATHVAAATIAVTNDVNPNVSISGGKVMALAGGGIAIRTEGSALISGGVVSSTTGRTIWARGTTSTVSVSGGEVSNSEPTPTTPVIYVSHSEWIGTNVFVSGTGKVTAKGANGTAIMTHGSVQVSGGEVSATGGRAIHTSNSETYAEGSGPTLTVSGGWVHATTGSAYYTNAHYSTLCISGGWITATDGCVYTSTCDNQYMLVEGGFVFAYGTSISDIICTGAVPVIENPGVVAAWNQYVWDSTPYTAGSDTDLTWEPGKATAVWAIEGGVCGIRYTNGTNTDFYPITEVAINPPAAKRGDANVDNEVDAADAAAILRFLAGLSELSDQGAINAEVTDETPSSPNRAAITAEDAAKILRFLAGLISVL